MRAELEPVATEILEREEVTLDHLEWGTMIELPRAAVTAGEIAETAEFFSFGTNDLTQTAFGFSRDDIGKFVGMYEERKLVPANPFVTIDRPGVGSLMRIACEEGSGRTRPAPRHLRRARGRSGERGVLPRDRARLRELLAVPGGDGAPGGRTGGGRRGGGRLDVEAGRGVIGASPNDRARPTSRCAVLPGVLPRAGGGSHADGSSIRTSVR